MLIGLDFDNTIVSYDEIFHKIALERQLIPANIPVNKLSVRDYLRQIDNENAWTEMQGYVYGSRMLEAQAYPGLFDALKKLNSEGHELFIVSHKTKYPFLGPKYDLHAAATQWILFNLQKDLPPLVNSKNIFFELTKKEKIARISALGCDVFVDDLPEIFRDNDFPPHVKPILFDSGKNYPLEFKRELSSISCWSDLPQYISRL